MKTKKESELCVAVSTLLRFSETKIDGYAMKRFKRCFFLPGDDLGNETETLQGVVRGKKLGVKWDWANFESTRDFQ